MIKAPIGLQDLRRRIYIKAKADKSWRFWGLYVHICKMETLQEAYNLAKKNRGAPGVDGVTFEEIEARGLESFLKQIQLELVQGTYRPQCVRKVEIPKGGGKFRTLSVPTIRDRVIQGAPISLVIRRINPVLRGWVNYFAIGHASRCFSYVRLWVEKKIRRHLMKARGRKGFVWKRWSNQWLCQKLGLFSDYRVKWPLMKAAPTR